MTINEEPLWSLISPGVLRMANTDMQIEMTISCAGTTYTVTNKERWVTCQGNLADAKDCAERAARKMLEMGLEP